MNNERISGGERMSDDKLYTLDELMAGKKPGEIKVRKFTDYWFQPFFKSGDGYWNGLDSRTEPAAYLSNRSEWFLYTEPAPKVVMYQWAYKPEKGLPWRSSEHFFTDEDAEAYLQSIRVYEKQRLDYTRQEFPSG